MQFVNHHVSTRLLEFIDIIDDEDMTFELFQNHWKMSKIATIHELFHLEDVPKFDFTERFMIRCLYDFCLFQLQVPGSYFRRQAVFWLLFAIFSSQRVSPREAIQITNRMVRFIARFVKEAAIFERSSNIKSILKSFFDHNAFVVCEKLTPPILGGLKSFNTQQTYYQIQLPISQQILEENQSKYVVFQATKHLEEIKSLYSDQNLNESTHTTQSSRQPFPSKYFESLVSRRHSTLS